MKFCSMQWTWGAGRLRHSERAPNKFGESQLLLRWTALDSKVKKDPTHLSAVGTGGALQVRLDRRGRHRRAAFVALSRH